MKNQLQAKLQHYFGYRDFREGQQEIIEEVLRGNDVLGILATGSGKSICYQLPSLLLPHITVVISPLISLMIDQVRETKAFRIKEVTALHSMQTFEERQAILQCLEKYKIIYISPEYIQNEFVIRALQRRKVSLFVIDEAHCISQWGYDFRPDYLRLTETIGLLRNPPVLALSGTITKQIEEDIVHELKRPHMKVCKYDTERKNITLVVEHIDKAQTKDERLVELLQSFFVPVIIYFSSRKQAEQIAHFLSQQLPDRKVTHYHGGLDHDARLKIQQQFLYDQLQIVCATSAFGMGINKPNVRMIIHYHLSSQMESFIQEIGRAGRDGEPSVSILLYERGDELIPYRLIEAELPTEAEARHLLNYLYFLFTSRKKIPVPIDKLSAQLELTETKVQFLLYQLESRNMIKDRQIQYNYDEWQRALSEIMSYSNKRKKQKEAKLKQMLTYIHARNCLRKTLYEQFQHKVTEGINNCCHICGYQLDEASFKSLEQPPLKKRSWQQNLGTLLGVQRYEEST